MSGRRTPLPADADARQEIEQDPVQHPVGRPQERIAPPRLQMANTRRGKRPGGDGGTGGDGFHRVTLSPPALQPYGAYTYRRAS